MRQFSLVFCWVLTVGLIHAQPGFLDPSFGQQGSYIFRPDTQTVCYGGGLDEQGHIMLSGWMEMPNDIDRYPLLARLMGDGNPDPSFGAGGFIDGAVIPELNGFPYFFTVDQQSDFKYLALARNDDGNHRLFRFNNDGSLDQSFAGAEFSLISPVIYRSAMDSQNRLIVSCISFTGDPIYQSYANMTVMRFTAEGALDNDFGSGGMTTIGNLQNDERCYDVAVDVNDNVYLAGYWSQTFSSGPVVARLYSLDVNGQLRADFGTGGYIELGETGVNVSFHGVNVSEATGDILVSGFRFNPQTYIQLGMVMRVTSQGDPVTSFGVNGLFISDDPENEVAYSYITELNDGKIAVAGRVNNDDFGRDVRVTLLTSNGSMDGTFGSTGNSSFFDVSLGDDDPLDIFQDFLGRILVAGYGFAIEDVPALGIEWGEKGFIACYQYSPETAVDNHVQQVVDIYPNPASDRVFITGGEGMSYRLTDTTGKLLYAGRIQTGSFSIRDLSPGLYLLTIGSEVHKLMVE